MPRRFTAITSARAREAETLPERWECGRRSLLGTMANAPIAGVVVMTDLDDDTSAIEAPGLNVAL